MPQQLLMNRFRPNIVVCGTPPFAEDGWRSFNINQVEFDIVKPCSRCKASVLHFAVLIHIEHIEHCSFDGSCVNGAVR